MSNDKILHPTAADFDALIGGAMPVLVDFWATWCNPCRMLMPTLDALADDYDGRVVIAKVDVDENPDLASRYGISTIPCLILFRDGQIVEKSVGARPKHLLSAMLEQAL